MDAKQSVSDLKQHLLKRGYSTTTLDPIFQKALNNRRTWVPPAPQTTATPPPTPTSWFFKIPFHPQNPTSAELQKAWDHTVANPRDNRKPLANIDVNWRRVGERRFILCYNRAPNLGNLLSYRKILPESGPPVSSFL